MYEPREDSEFLAGFVKEYARGSVLDMGTGSGIQAKTAKENENVTEVQREFRRQFHRNPSMRRTIACIRDKFEADRTVQDIHKQRSGRPRALLQPRTG